MGETLDLKTFIALAEKNDPNFELIQSNKEKLKFLVDLGLPTRALLISARTEYGFSNDSDLNTRSTTVGVQKNILETGTSVSVERTESKRPDREENVLQFRLEQALYNNYFGSDVRFKNELLELQVKKVKMEIVELYEDYLLDISALYYDYAQAFYNYDLAKKVHAESLKLLQDVKARYQKKIATNTDLARVELQVLLAKEEIITRDGELKSKITALEKITGKSFSHVTPDLELKVISTKKLDTAALYELRSYKIAKMEAQVAQGNEKLAGKAGDAQVNLIAGYNIDQSTRFGTQIDRHEKVVGVEFSVPIGDNLQEATLLEAHLNQRQKQLQLKDTLLTLNKTWADLSEQLRTSQEILTLAKRKITLAQNIIKDDQNRYAFGKLDLDSLIQLRKDYSAYRYQYYSQLVRHNLLQLRWKGFTDTLLAK